MNDIYGLKTTLSNYCGYKCKYCFVDTDNTTLIQKDIFEKWVDFYIFQKGDIKRFLFLGGEVLLFFDTFIEFVDIIIQKSSFFHHKNYIYLVTSGLGMTPERAKILLEKKVLLGVSIDGSYSFDEKNRVDRKGNPIYQRTLESLQILNQYYDDTNLGYTITVDEETVYFLFDNFLFLSNLDSNRRNVGIAATYTVQWKSMNIYQLKFQLHRICQYIYENITQSNFYYYNILGFFILEILRGKKPKNGNLEIHVFPDGASSEMLFAQSKWENKTHDPNQVRFEMVLPYAYKIIQESKKNILYEKYISSLYHKAIF